MTRLNRIYIKDDDLITSLYRRGKEQGFTTEDVMRLHWDRQGEAALEWARLRIKRMRANGAVEAFDPPEDSPLAGDQRRKLYRVTEAKLRELGWHD